MARAYVLVVALLALPTGCRSESRDAAETAKTSYQATLASQAAKFGPKVTRVASALKQGSSTDEVLGYAKEAELEAAAFIRVLDGIQVPAVYQAGHAKMKNGLARFVEAMPKFIHAKTVGDSAEEAEATRKFAESNVDIVNAKEMIFADAPPPSSTQGRVAGVEIPSRAASPPSTPAAQRRRVTSVFGIDPFGKAAPPRGQNRECYRADIGGNEFDPDFQVPPQMRAVLQDGSLESSECAAFEAIREGEKWVHAQSLKDRRTPAQNGRLVRVSVAYPYDEALMAGVAEGARERYGSIDPESNKIRIEVCASDGRCEKGHITVGADSLTFHNDSVLEGALKAAAVGNRAEAADRHRSGFGSVQ